MSDKKLVTRLHGRYYTIEIYKSEGWFSSDYYVRRSDGKSLGVYKDRDRAVKAAYKAAGPNAVESRLA